MRKFVLKLFLAETINNFYDEVVKNMKNNKDSEHIVKMIRAKAPCQIPCLIEGQEISLYSYILLPYYENESLLHFIVKAIKKGWRSFSPNLAGYLFSKAIKCVKVMH